MGRAFRYQRRIAHIIVTVAEKTVLPLLAGRQRRQRLQAKKTAGKTAAKKAPAKKAAAKKTATKKAAQEGRKLQHAAW